MPVFLAEIFETLTSVKYHTGRNKIWALSKQKKKYSGHNGIQGNEDADVLARRNQAVYFSSQS
jgi:hypothetical protein